MAILNQKLYRICTEELELRLNEVKKQIEELQYASNNESKSSAGDKYETGREMMQQEINKSSLRFLELKKMKVTLERITIPEKNEKVQLGNVVITNHGKYFLSVSLGSLIIDKDSYQAISYATPLAQKLLGLSCGDSFVLNGKTFFLEQII